MFREIAKLPEFEKDLKKLRKRFRTLDEDIDNLIKFALVPFHTEGVDYGGIVVVSDLGIEEPKIYKVRKFACRALKGKGNQTGIRIIYAYFKDEDRIEFVEVYFKGDKETEDRKRIRSKYIKESK
jgi:mRNA-degrading endonuclease RelE of RelBE toxin-antitoxin system